MTENTKHTPTPKLVAAKNEDGTFNIGYSDYENSDYDGVPQVTVAENIDPFNKHFSVDFIVRACNSHNALVAALQYCLEAANAHEAKALHSGKLHEIVQEKARAALALAKGES